MPAKRKHPEICTIDGCDRPHEAKGMCHRHYKAWRRRNLPHVKEARKTERKQTNKNYRSNQENKIKIKCHNDFNRAILNGEIERQPCEKCGVPDAEGHHDDYSKPLDVRWLCDEHHREFHGR